MDITKLEKLSCLHLNEKDIAAMQESLQGVFDMMSSLHDVLENPIDETVQTTLFVDKRQNEKFSTTQLEEGFFLAPKVIKKDE